MNATETHTQEQAVMEAILTKGPMTVSVNAEVIYNVVLLLMCCADEVQLFCKGVQATSSVG